MMALVQKICHCFNCKYYFQLKGQVGYFLKIYLPVIPYSLGYHRKMQHCETQIVHVKFYVIMRQVFLSSLSHIRGRERRTWSRNGA